MKTNGIEISKIECHRLICMRFKYRLQIANACLFHTELFISFYLNIGSRLLLSCVDPRDRAPHASETTFFVCFHFGK